MSEEKNRVEYSGSKVIKTFASRSAFITESRIYQKLNGSGLAAEMTDSWDGVIELERLEGENFAETVAGLKRSPDKLLASFDMFWDWYIRYRDITKISIGDMDFGDFIVTPEGLKAIDFEHCKAGGFAEQDAAKLIAYVCVYPDGYTSSGLESAKILAGSANSHLELDSEKLYKAIMKSLKDICAAKGIEPIPAADEYIATFSCCRAVIMAESPQVRRLVDSEYIVRCGTPILADLKGILSNMPEKVVCAMPGDDVGSEFPVITDAGKGDLRLMIDVLQ
jgi:hypothetical protein